jgi:hypothetical protein
LEEDFASVDVNGAHQLLWLGINTETWAIVLATALGPVMAILITRWRDRVREIHSRRMRIFRTLMATRRQTITPDHVVALNLIEVNFYGVKSIEKAWRVYHRHLNSAPRGRPMTPNESSEFEEARNDLLAKLLFAIAQFLNFTLSEIDVRNGGYAPDGWRYRDERQGELLELAREMAAGRRPLPVYPVQSASESQATQRPK